MEKALSLSCTDSTSYIELIEVPALTNSSNQMVEGFFTATPEQTNITQEILQKEDFDIDKVQICFISCLLPDYISTS